jgi:hypothetical protein
MNKKKKILTISITMIILIGISTVLTTQNEYEQMFIGTWANDQDSDLFVFEENNIVYLMDEDGIRLTENGRWRATSDTLAVELQYNGKRYRLIFKYEILSEDKVEMNIIKNLVDGKEVKSEESKFILTKVE